MSGTDPTPRRRSDATRNRAAILAAAAALAAAAGPEISVQAVARAAGVAVGTVYRHWPTKDHLLDEVLEGRLDAVATDAEQATSLGAFFDSLTALCVRDRPLLQLLDRSPEPDGADPGGAHPESPGGRRDRLDVAIAALIVHARGRGVLRTPIRPRDLRIYLVGLRAALDSDDPAAWRRHHAVYRAGLLDDRPSPVQSAGGGTT